MIQKLPTWDYDYSLQTLFRVFERSYQRNLRLTREPFCQANAAVAAAAPSVRAAGKLNVYSVITNRTNLKHQRDT